MKGSLPAVWRNLVLLYLGLFLIMSAWGKTSEALNGRVWPAVASASRESPPIYMEMLGLWPPGPTLWGRLLQIGIPGFRIPPGNVQRM